MVERPQNSLPGRWSHAPACSTDPGIDNAADHAGWARGRPRRERVAKARVTLAGRSARRAPVKEALRAAGLAAAAPGAATRAPAGATGATAARPFAEPAHPTETRHFPSQLGRILRSRLRLQGTAP